VDLIGVAHQLIDEFKSRFLAYGVMDALRVVYPQYWLQGDCETNFQKYLDVNKKFFGESRKIYKEEGKKLVPLVLDCFLLELQQPMFKLAMLSNAMVAIEPPFW